MNGPFRFGPNLDEVRGEPHWSSFSQEDRVCEELPKDQGRSKAMKIQRSRCAPQRSAEPVVPARWGFADRVELSIVAEDA